ncbi:MAG: hypothetical protein AAGC70_07560 [Pseudomonadota bacterium]
MLRSLIVTKASSVGESGAVRGQRPLPRVEWLTAVRCARPLPDEIHLLEFVERDHLGALLNAVAYAAVATLALVLVLKLGWHDRFLIAAICFGGIALMALSDTFVIKTVRYYRLETRVNGATLTYVTPDLEDARQTLAAARGDLMSIAD